ncbi:protein yippee-like At4g27745 [Selaginella moellendorffii]|uniref:protein yippee-like At4g27745 n=1 Tax=Selaginella moellendorffii TaxID=88036 RepID=UPI000D1C2919|nr:protein yippee-like At4g27745 [Selaginella moellendorffii]|eukprot:XP_024539199.1 protein yippee-like At4g27745 [Selaginella moellendorffii]
MSSSSSSSISGSSSSSDETVVPLLSGGAGARLYSCANCRSNVADHSDVISTAFQGRNGRAYLLGGVDNVVVGPREDRHLMTGLHAVADISCAHCHELLGWKYERAYEHSQKYKEGKFVLERSKIMKDCW